MYSIKVISGIMLLGLAGCASTQRVDNIQNLQTEFGNRLQATTVAGQKTAQTVSEHTQILKRHDQELQGLRQQLADMTNKLNRVFIKSVTK